MDRSAPSGPRWKSILVSIVVLSVVATTALGGAVIASDSNRRTIFRAVDATGVGHALLYAVPGVSKRLFGRAMVGDGRPPGEAWFVDPSSIAQGPDGRLFVSDRRDHRIRVISDGRVTTYLGTGVAGASGEGRVQPRGEARVAFPEGLAIDSLGRLLFVDAGNHRIRRVEGDSLVRTVAGDGREAYDGDGGPAVDASLTHPSDICLGDDGSIHIADTGSHVIRRVTPGGTIETVAGTGRAGFSGDGGPARDARLAQPWGLECAPGGGLLIADSENHRIRRVGPDGTIRTVAGTGRHGFGGDGGPAVDATFDSPQELVIDGRGGLYVVDEHGNRIRYIDAHGQVGTIAGTGEAARARLGRPAVESSLDDPEDVLVPAVGGLLVVEGDSRRIVEVDSSGDLRAFAGR